MKSLTVLFLNSQHLQDLDEEITEMTRKKPCASQVWMNPDCCVFNIQRPHSNQLPLFFILVFSVDRKMVYETWSKMC